MATAPKTKSSSTRKAGHAKAPAGSKWSIDISQPVSDKIMDPAAFEKFLQDRIKLEGGKPGQFGDKVKISREGDARIVITTTVPISKRYIKFLAKKHLKKSGTRDFLRVHAGTNKQEYVVSYLSSTAADAGDDDDE